MAGTVLTGDCQYGRRESAGFVDANNRLSWLGTHFTAHPVVAVHWTAVIMTDVAIQKANQYGEDHG